MKIISSLFVVAALAVSSGAISPLPVQAQVANTAKPQPSLEKFNELMKKGREFKAESERAYSVFHSTEAVRAFDQAAGFAPTSLQRAEAYVEAGESLYPMAEMPLAIAAFNAALKEEISPELKGRALWGIARSEFHIAFMAQSLAKNATRLRANYEAASKARKLSEEEKREVSADYAKLYEAEGKHIDAAREWSQLMEGADSDRGKEFRADDTIKQLKKATQLTPAQNVEAAQITDKVFKVLLPLRKKRDIRFFHVSRLDYATLLNQFGQPARAETVWNEIANDATVEEKTRANAILQVSQSQLSQKKYDAALQTIERLNSLPSHSKAQVFLERAKILIAQNKLNLATGEYAKALTATPTPTPDEKAQAFLGLADVSGKEAEELRQKKAPEAQIKDRLDSQKRQLFIAQLQSAASWPLRREAMLKLAEWETAYGTPAEAEKWKAKTEAVRSNKG